MSFAILGLITALCWGTADFISRFTSRALGFQSALAGMLLTSALLLSAYFLIFDVKLVYSSGTFWLLMLTGVSLMLATSLLYAGINRGPIAVVAPIVGSYPVFSLIFAVLAGVKPSGMQWAAMALTMFGVALVALSSADAGEIREANRKRTVTILIALGSAFLFAVTVASGQTVATSLGELQTVMLARWIALIACGLMFVVQRTMPSMRMAWVPLLGLQGTLDAAAYVAILAAGNGAGAEISVVIASSFSAVTVILARLFLRETMTRLQWCGIAAILTGAGLLSG